jgi:hypothetical protein
MRHICGTGEVHIGFWWGDMMERDHLEDTNIDRMIILKYIFEKLDGDTWTSLMWQRIGTGVGRL